MEKISEANDRIRQLEEANKDVQRGAVIAFNSDPSRPCPDKWKLFGPASGRFVVGAGDNGSKDANGTDLGDYTAGTTSGGKLHQLTGPEMPSHKHRISTNTQTDIHNGLGGSGVAEGILSTFQDIPNKPGWPTVLPDLLEATGSNQPHNTMPPFVALYYCIKE